MSCDIRPKNPPPTTFFDTNLITEIENRDDPTDVLDLCDASTVVNVSLMNKEKKKVFGRQKYVNESPPDNSTNISETSTVKAEPAQVEPDQSVDGVNKVVGWLERSLIGPCEESDLEGPERAVTDYWMVEDSSPNCSKHSVRRVHVFLLQVEPNPESEPLDLVSGYCYDGCKCFSPYSTIVWVQQDNYDIPLCPNCMKSDLKKELKLTFKFIVKVMDTRGIHADLNVWKHHGEYFLGCSTEDFIRKASIRKKTVTPLTQYTVANTIHDKYTPLLDMNVVCVNDLFFIVDSAIKKEKRKRQEVLDNSEPINLNKCKTLNAQEELSESVQSNKVRKL